MSVKNPQFGINLRKNDNQYNPGYGQYYPKDQERETISLAGLIKHMADHNSIYGEDVIEGVLTKMRGCVIELLSQGNSVKLDGLGTFYLSVKTIGEQNADDFGAGNIKRVSIQFLADKSKDYDWNSKSQTTRSRFQLESASAGQGTASGGGSGSTTGQGDEGEDRP